MALEPDIETGEPERGAGRAVAVAFGVVVLFLVLQIVAGVALAAAGEDIELTGRLSARDALVLSVTQAIGILGGLGLIAAGFSTARRIGFRPAHGAQRAAMVALLPIALLVIVPSFGAAVATGKALVAPGLGAAQIAAFMLLAVLIAVNEELWFRGFVIDALGGWHRPWMTVGVSALLFGLPHTGNTAASLLNAGAVTLAVGIPFAVVRLRYGALMPLIVMHAAIDAWAFLHEASVTPKGNPSPEEVAAGMVLPALVALGYLLWLRRSLTAGVIVRR